MAQRDPFEPAALWGWGIVVLLLVLVPVACTVSQAAELTERGVVLTPDECKAFGELLEQAADARDAGIGARLYSAFLQRRFLRRGASGAERVRDMLLREVRRAYQSGLDGALLGIEGYTRCMSGPLGGPEAALPSQRGLAAGVGASAT